MLKIFISYARESQSIADSISRDLDSLNYDVWYDQQLSGGQAWWEEILENIRKSDILVIVMSDAFLQSQACRVECNYANSLGKAILPVLTSDDLDTSLLPPVLASVQYVDRRVDDKTSLVALIRALVRLPPSSTLPDPLPPPPAVPISYFGGLLLEVEKAEDLTRTQQWDLVGRLKSTLNEPNQIRPALKLLQKLRAREDTYAVIASEIDEIFKAYKVDAIQGFDGSIDFNAFDKNQSKRRKSKLGELELQSFRDHFIKYGELPEVDFVAFVCGVVESGADVNISDSLRGNSLLHYAARNGLADSVELLLDAGADVNSKNSYGLKPVDLAQEDTVRGLLRKYRKSRSS